MADYGIKKGLAIDLGYNQRINDLARQNNAMRQAQIYSENKAKLLADDFDYNNAMNAWDNNAVKSYAQGKLKEIGQFMRTNPDFETNIEKRVAYKNLVKELKDNRALNEGLQVDSNIKAMQQYMNDPKNAPLVQSEDFQPIMNQYQNYIKTGSIDGVGQNRKLFTFTPPEELVDTTPMLMKYAQATSPDQEKTVYLSGNTAAKKKWVSDYRKGQVAESALNDSQLGRYIKQEYNKYASNLEEGQNPMTLQQYAVSKLNPYFKASEYDKYSVPTKSADGDGSSSKGKLDLFNDLIKFTAQRPNQYVAANSKGVKELFTGGDEQFSLAGKGFRKSNGEFVPFKDALIPSSSLITSDSKAIYDPDRKMNFITAKVKMPLDKAKNILQGENPINDPWTNVFMHKSFETVGPIEGYEGINTFLEDGVWQATMDVNIPVDPANNKSVNAAYDHAAGQGVSGYTGAEDERIFYSPDMTQYRDSYTGKTYDTKTGQEIQ